VKNNRAGSTRQMGRFETEILSTKGNLLALLNLLGKWIAQVHIGYNPEGQL
jgi:hypothetical protein